MDDVHPQGQLLALLCSILSPTYLSTHDPPCMLPGRGLITTTQEPASTDGDFNQPSWGRRTWHLLLDNASRPHGEDGVMT